MIVEKNGNVILTPDDGYKYITNGEVYTDFVILGKNDSAENWTNTNIEPVEVEE